MVNAVLPGMRQRRSGLIINLGSIAPAVPAPFHAYLSASKAAVNTFTDALRLEVRHLGIAVTTVEPGAMAIQALVIILGSALLFGVNWGQPAGVAAVVILFALVGVGAGIFLGTLFRTGHGASITGILPQLGVLAAYAAVLLALATWRLRHALLA